MQILTHLRFGNIGVKTDIKRELAKFNGIFHRHKKALLLHFLFQGWGAQIYSVQSLFYHQAFS